MPLGEPLRPRKEVFDYSRANESGGGTKAAAAAGGAYMKVYVRLRPNEGGTGAELSYNLPEQNKISIKENREPFPQEHQFTFHRIYERDAPQEVSIQKKKGVTFFQFFSSCFYYLLLVRLTPLLLHRLSPFNNLLYNYAHNRRCFAT